MVLVVYVICEQALNHYLSPELTSLHGYWEHRAFVGKPGPVEQSQLVAEAGGQLWGAEQGQAEVVVVPHFVRAPHEEQEGLAQGTGHKF